MTKNIDDLRVLYDSELAPTLSEIQGARADTHRQALCLFVILFIVLGLLLFRSIHSNPLFALIPIALAAIVALIFY